MGLTSAGIARPAAVAAMLAFAAALLASASPQSETQLITLSEAKILVYLSPQVMQVRTKGGGVSIVEQEGAAWDLQNFYRLWVVNYTADHAESSTVGFFSINKHTGDVWQDDPRPKPIKVSGTDLEGVQFILRDAHGIDAQAVEQYHLLNPSLAQNSK